MDSGMRAIDTAEIFRSVRTGAVADRAPWNMLTRSAKDSLRAGLGGAVSTAGPDALKTNSGDSVTASLLSVMTLDRSSSSYEEVVPASEPSKTGVEGLAPFCGTQVLSKIHFFAFCVGCRCVCFRGGVFGRSRTWTLDALVKGLCVFSYCSTWLRTDLNCEMAPLSSSVSNGSSMR